MNSADQIRRLSGEGHPYGLWLLYAFTAVSVLGFAVFGAHPENLKNLGPTAIGVYAVSFRFFALGQVFLAGAVIIGFLVRNAGLKWIPAFIALYAISLTSELLGTGYGIPFGAYSYSAVLKPMWLGRVPIGIPLSWFYMAVPAYAISLNLLPAKANAVRRIVLASFILMAWDLALDPAMSKATRYWEWGETGPYYGMPLLNLVGWYVTGVALMSALVALRAEEWISKLSVKWLIGFYSANVLLAVGISVAAGLWLVLAFTIAAIAITAVLASILSASSQAADSGNGSLLRLMKP
jgi:putative membrane protein